MAITEDVWFKLGFFCKMCKGFFRLIENKPNLLRDRYETRDGEDCL